MKKQIYMFAALFWIACLLLGSTKSAQKYETVHLSPDENGVLGVDDVVKSYHIRPGDTIFLKAGNYAYIYLGNIQGSKSRPVVITNDKGLVRVGVAIAYPVAFQIYNSNYFKLEGTGTPTHRFGIEISGIRKAGGYADGLYLNRGVSDFSLNHLYIHDANHFIVALQMASCEHPAWNRENYLMKNVRIHDVKGVHAIFEGFYIGPTSYFSVGPCGKVNNHLIENLEIDHNIIKRTGNEGIQVAMAALGNNRIHHNWVYDYGLSKSEFQTNGILIGGAVKASVYDNAVINGSGNGIQVLGGGINKIFNNVIVSSGADGIQIGQRMLFEPLIAEIMNNTIVNSRIKSISIYDTIRVVRHKIYNNLMIHQGSSFNRGTAGIDATEQVADMQMNKYLPDIQKRESEMYRKGQFSNRKLHKDYYPGKNVVSFGIKEDFSGKKRPTGKPTAIGAFQTD